MKAMILAASLAIPAAVLHAEVQSKIAPVGVVEKMDKLEMAVRDAGATVFARVDHTAGATSVVMTLRPEQPLIFGNPQLGTPAMQDDPLAGLYLPLRVLVFEGDDGRSVVAWNAPDVLFEGLMIPEDEDSRAKIAGALEKLTNAAVAY